MSEHELPPLPADVAQLIAEAGPLVPPAGLHDALLARLDHSLTAGGGGGGGGMAGGGGVSGAVGRYGLWLSGGTLLLGLVGGVLLAPILRPPPPVRLAAPIVTPSPPAPAVVSPELPLEPVQVEEPPAAKPPRIFAPVTAPRPAPLVRDTVLAEERALVEMARTALARGNAQQALQTMDTHAVRFANGQLVEERESLAIEALLAAGRTEDAKRRADAFRARFPQSMLLPAIEAAFE